MATLSEQLSFMLHRARVGTQTLSKLTGLPRTAIDNWRDGTVRRPRQWSPLLRIAAVLRLPRDEVDALLTAAGFPDLGGLARTIAADHADRPLLRPWLGGVVTMAPRQIRASTSDYVGRSEPLDVLGRALRRAEGGAVAAVTGVRGMGGVGKTELAIVLANRLRDDFPDGQVVVALRGVSANPLPPGHAVRQVIHALQPDAQLPDDVDALHQRYCAVLHGRRVLVLADDAGGAAQVRPLLPPPGSALLVTSRQRFSLPGMTTVDLGLLREAEAVALLVAICPRLTEARARSIARTCGYLPLALRICGSALHNDPALLPAEFEAALADGRARLALLRDPDDPHLDVAASLELSYDRLDDAGRSVLRQLGVLVGDFGAELAAAVVEVPDGGAVHRTLRALLRANLVEYDPAADRWHLHDLVRDVAVGHLSAAETDEVRWRYAEAGVALIQAARAEYLTGGDAVRTALARVDTERAHVDVGRTWAAAHAGTERADRLLVASVLATVHLVALRPDIHTELLPQAEVALVAARRLADRAAEITVLHMLGNLHLDAGRSDRALVCFDQQLGAARTARDPAAEARALNNLSAAYLNLGEFQLAVPLNHRQLELARAAGDPRGEAMAWCNLGHAHLRLGAADLALSELEAGLALARQLGHRNGECAVLDNLGVAWLGLGEVDRAIDLIGQALDIALELADQRSQAQILPDLARAVLLTGQGDPAQEYAARAVEIGHELQAPRVVAYARTALGEVRLAVGDRESGRHALTRAWATLRECGDRYGEAECAWQLGRDLATDDPARAGPLLRAALAYRREVGHRGVADIAAVLDGLAGSDGVEPAG